MFKLQNVSKVYSRRGHEIVALQVASLEIQAGDYLAIVGPSGSGKTTLLSILGGMLSPNEGQVSLHGVSMYDLSVAQRAALRRQKIGFVFQTFNLVPYLTALENVQVPLYLSGVAMAFQHERAASLLSRVGLADRMGHKPGEMSTGQQQRVALARTLANHPPVILADEPTGNLDPESRHRVLEFFGELNRAGQTIVMVTHDPVAAAQAKGRLVLSDGRISNEPAGGQGTARAA